MKDVIVQELGRLEQERGIEIIFACESGSRAWGFASQDSDYDVRFVYLSPLEEYLSIRNFRDNIEEKLPGDLDLSGWDLRKALGLALKSNPPLLEWLRSPIMYLQREPLFEEFARSVESCYSADRCFLHYFHMALGNFRDYLRQEEVWTKKYLYVLRPILACRWIERNPALPVPMEFQRIVDSVVEDSRLHAAIAALVERKKAGLELARGARDEVLSSFIESELVRLEAIAPKQVGIPDARKLDEYFRATVLGKVGP